MIHGPPFPQRLGAAAPAMLEVSVADLRAMNPEVVFCGLFDRVERVIRVYDEEIARRGLKS